MPRQTMLFTALPNGPDLAGPLRLSVFVSPRLFPDHEDGRLGEFPDLVSWPATVAAVTWSVELDGTVVPATVTTPPGEGPDARWWQALFPEETFVRGHTQPDYADRDVVSYSVADALDRLRGIWVAALAAHPTGVPANLDLLHLIGSSGGWATADFDSVLATIGDRGQDVPGPQDAPPGDMDERGTSAHPGRGPSREERMWRNQQEQDWIRRQRKDAEAYESALAERETHRQVVAKIRAEIDPEEMLRQSDLSALYDVRDFHVPRSSSPVDSPHVPPVLPTYDFHQLVAMLGSHPAVLRRLGLVVDLELDLSAPLVGGGTVRVVPQWAPSLPGDPSLMTPTTLLDPTTFRAAPAGADGEVDRGFVRLADPDGNSRVTAVVTDADGASMTMLAAAEGLVRRLVWRDGEHDDTRDGLPTMRSAGMSLALGGRGARLKAAFTKAHATNAALGTGASAPLDADDLTRGWRVDVRPSGGTWLSTAARHARYAVRDPDADPLTNSGEGFHTPTASGAGDAYQKPGGALHVPESLFLWQGWSLSVPRPGTPIDLQDKVGEPDPTQASGPLGVDVHNSVVAGSLPSLRFGRSYAFRLRAADLAGNGPDLGDPEPPGAAVVSEPVPYLRFDPVAPPLVLSRTARLPGDGPLRVVLRSDVDAPPSPPTAERHVVPPRTSELQAEQHGRFDVDGHPDPAAYAVLAPGAGPSEDGTYATAPGSADPEFAGTGTADDPGAWFWNVDQAPMAYLPDPLAAGAALRGLPATHGAVLVPFAPAVGEKWPLLRPFRLVLREGPPGHEWSHDQRVLTVTLPKGESREVALSSWLDEADLPLLGLRDWYLQAGPTAEQAVAFDRSAHRGHVWALTPAHRMLLVHAVSRPLVEPRIHALVAIRSPGLSYAELRGELGFSRVSTGAVDLVATWTEKVDVGQGNVEAAQGGPERVPDPHIEPPQHRSSVLPLTLDDGAGHRNRLGVARRQDFGDGRHRMVTYRAVATTSFLEYFTRRAEITMPAALPAEVPVDAQGLVAATVVVTDTSGTAYRVADATNPDGIFTVDPVAGSVLFGDGVTGERPAPGSSLHVTCNVPEVSRTSQPMVVNVPASVRPAPPKVLYAVPTFAWSGVGTLADGKLSSDRRGNSLRVYLDRPWWSSGDGELLGVVLLPLDAPVPVADEVRQHMTSWGDDPVNPVTARIGPWPVLENLPEAVRSARGQRVEELPYRRMDVAGFEVGFDSDRKLYWCDIAIDPRGARPTYRPFLRLALARWQPDALPDHELSRVVTADFIQLGPDRSASVVPDPDGESLAITVAGAVPHERNVARAWVQAAVAGVKDPDLAWEEVDGTRVDLTLDLTIGWRGQLRLPDAYAPDRFRLVVEEAESYPLAPDGAERGERLIYFDVIPL